MDKDWDEWTNDEIRRAARDHSQLDADSAHTLVYAIGRHGYRDLASQVEDLIDHKDLHVRHEALHSLVGRMGLVEYLPRALEAFDRDDFVAEQMPMTLTRFLGERPDYHTQIMELLVTKLATSADPNMQRSIYRAILQIGRIGKRGVVLHHLPHEFDVTRDVDWDPLLKWLPPDIEAPEGVISTWEVATPADLETIRNKDAPDSDLLEAAERLLLDRRQEARTALIWHISRKGGDPTTRTQLLRMYMDTWGTIGGSTSIALALKRELDEDLRYAIVDALATDSLANPDHPIGRPEPFLKAYRDGPSARIRTRGYEVLRLLLDNPDALPHQPPPIDEGWDLVRHQYTTQFSGGGWDRFFEE